LVPFSTSTVSALALQKKGFRDGFSDGTYGYLLPASYSDPGEVYRFQLSSFSNVEVLSLTADDLKGFRGGFTHGAYGYLVPYYNNQASYNGKLVRFELSSFSSYEVLDLTQKQADLKSFHGGFTDGSHGYLLPHNGWGQGSKIVRFPLSSFSLADVEVLDLVQNAPSAAGLTGSDRFVGGFTDGVYGYMVPYSKTWVVRFQLSSFSTVEVLDVAESGFQTGFTDGTYGYLVQYGKDGKVVRFKLSSFADVQTIDLAGETGFSGGFTDGTYGYAMPSSHGKIARFDLTSFSNVQLLDMTDTQSNLKSFKGGFTDGTYGYTVPSSYSIVGRFPVVPHTPGIGWDSSP
jgi:hypothetical protein